MADNTKQTEIDIEKEAWNVRTQLFRGLPINPSYLKFFESFIASLIQRVQIAEREKTLDEISLKARIELDDITHNKVRSFNEVFSFIHSLREGTPMDNKTL